MPQFTQETTAGPVYASNVLVGSGHVIVDRLMSPSLNLAAGRVVGFDSSTGAIKAIDTAVKSTSLTGSTGVTEFNLGHAGVDPDSLVVTEDGAPRLPGTYSVSAGTGTSGVDEIVFNPEPVNTKAVVVKYKLSIAKPAGVLLNAVVTAADEETTKMPVVIWGGVKRSSLAGVPAHLNFDGAQLGGLTLEG